MNPGSQLYGEDHPSFVVELNVAHYAANSCVCLSLFFGSFRSSGPKRDISLVNPQFDFAESCYMPIHYQNKGGYR